MEKRDIPDYNSSKHFLGPRSVSLQFWVSEWNKNKKGVLIDGHEMSPWMYFPQTILKPY
jgi:hypothetical protein